MAELIRIDRNGTKYYKGLTPCGRCGGLGVYIVRVENNRPIPSDVASGVCFKCGGSGEELTTWKEYTPKYMERLTAQRAKRRAKWEAEHAEEIAEREREKQRRLEEQAERIRQQQERDEAERAKRARSQYIGTVGEKIETPATMERVASYNAPSFRGYGVDIITVYTFRTDEGNALTWKTSNGSLEFVEGKRVTVRGTVKAHEEYRDEKQTRLIRVKI